MFIGILKRKERNGIGNPNYWDMSNLGDPSEETGILGEAIVGMWFSSDGLKMILGTYAYDVYEYDLSVAWDVSSYTLGTSGTVLKVNSGLWAKNDGTRLYTGGWTSLAENSLASPFNLTSITQQHRQAVVYSDAMYMKSDETQVWITNRTDETVEEWSMSTPGLFSTLSYVKNFDFSAKVTDPNALHLSGDGLRLYLANAVDGNCHQYDLGTEWDVSTAVFSATYGSYTMNDMFWKPDGTRLYYAGSGGKIIWRDII